MDAAHISTNNAIKPNSGKRRASGTPIHPSTTAFVALILWAPGAAFAHGEEAVLLLLGQFVVVVVCAVASFLLLRGGSQTWVGFVGCLAGVAAAWMVTADVPFQQRQSLVTMLNLGLPLLTTAVAVWGARKLRAAPAPAPGHGRASARRPLQREP